MNLSYWEQKYITEEKDLIIIGAGIVGLSAALEARRQFPNSSIRVLEKQHFGAVASTRNAGFACFGSVSEIISDFKKYDKPVVLDIIQRRRRGIDHISKTFPNIGLVMNGGYEIFRDEDDFKSSASKVSEINALMGEEVYTIISTPFELNCHDRCIFNKDEGQLDISLFYGSLLEQVRINNIEVLFGIEIKNLSLSEGSFEIVVNHEVLSSKGNHIILATNAFTRGLIDQFNVVPVRNQVILTKEIPELKLRGTFHLDEGFIYFRNVDSRILIGGGRQKFDEELTDNLGLNDDNIDYLVNLLHHLTKYDIQIEQSWSGILCGGHDRLSIVKKLSDRVTVAARLGGMGVAIGMNTGIDAATLAMK